MTWWGLRAGERWALAVATWLWVSRPYFAHDAPLTLADAPPFMWVTTLFWIPATVTGWLALARA